MWITSRQRGSRVLCARVWSGNGKLDYIKEVPSACCDVSPPTYKHIHSSIRETANDMIILQNVTLCFRLSCCHHDNNRAWLCTCVASQKQEHTNSLYKVAGAGGVYWSRLGADRKWLLGDEPLQYIVFIRMRWSWTNQSHSLPMLLYLLGDNFCVSSQ